MPTHGSSSHYLCVHPPALFHLSGQATGPLEGTLAHDLRRLGEERLEACVGKMQVCEPPGVLNPIALVPAGDEDILQRAWAPGALRYRVIKRGAPVGLRAWLALTEEEGIATVSARIAVPRVHTHTHTHRVVPVRIMRLGQFARAVHGEPQMADGLCTS